jgi:hypothetical protein
MRILVATATAVSICLPVAAFADDASYCNALSAAYRDYARSGQIDTNAAAAMSQCNSNPTSAIPVLEKILKDNRVTLPSRT